MGRDAEERLHLLVALRDRKAPPWISALKARAIHSSVRDLRIGKKPAQRFVDVELNTGESLELAAPFLGFVEHFVDRARRSKSDPFKILRGTFEEWKLAWSQERHEFTEEWARGLIAELAFLEIAISHAGTRCARRWRGPKAPQDFSQGKVAFEVKSSATVPHRPVISSIDQLDAGPFAALYLVCVLLERNESGVSLDQIVGRIRKELSGDAISLMHFGQVLEEYGFSGERGSAYSTVKFSVGNADVFRCDGSFPKVVRSAFKETIDERVLSLSYRLTLTGLSALSFNSAEVRRGLKKLAGN